MPFPVYARVCIVMLLIGGVVCGQMPSNTLPLKMDGDIASQMVDGIDRFLLNQIAVAKAERGTFWNYDTTSPQAFQDSIQPNRDRLTHMLGIRDQRVEAHTPFDAGPLDDSTVIARCDAFHVYRIRWPVLPLSLIHI